MTYIATFYAHIGAIRYKKRCDSAGIPARLMPVPRSLSSSCGSCVRWEGALLLPQEESREEVEQIVRVTEHGYEPVYRAEES